MAATAWRTTGPRDYLAPTWKQQWARYGERDSDWYLWTLSKPSKTLCASFCGKTLAPEMRISEVRPTGLAGTAQEWWYCPACWERLVVRREMKMESSPLKSAFMKPVSRYYGEQFHALLKELNLLEEL